MIRTIRVDNRRLAALSSLRSKCGPVYPSRNPHRHSRRLRSCSPGAFRQPEAIAPVGPARVCGCTSCSDGRVLQRCSSPSTAWRSSCALRLPRNPAARILTVARHANARRHVARVASWLESGECAPMRMRSQFAPRGLAWRGCCASRRGAPFVEGPAYRAHGRSPPRISRVLPRGGRPGLVRALPRDPRRSSS